MLGHFRMNEVRERVCVNLALKGAWILVADCDQRSVATKAVDHDALAAGRTVSVANAGTRGGAGRGQDPLSAKESQ
jgi:hypothetical protein